ncbi:MAG: hypothetical protein Q9217_005621 [Psora testacea]
MGGNAFQSGPSPLCTPRMPPELYFLLRNQYNGLFRALYKRVATPIEAPSKFSYGDIDILVSEPWTESLAPELVAAHLDAKRTLTNHGSPTTSFAVPYPHCPGSFVQVDVHVCSPETFEWQLFHQSHGDLWNLLGTTIRPVGLTANNRGLHLRIEDIERLDRQKSLVFLTREAEAVVRFLGLNMEKYKKPFESKEEMYEFVRACRFFDPKTYQRGGLKANDRKRMAKREIYRRFVEEWVPEHCNIAGDGTLLRPTRGEIMEEALDTFEKREEYETPLKDWRMERVDSLTRQEQKAGRKLAWAEIEGYADAWTRWLKRRV